MQFCDLSTGDLFSIRKYGEPRVYEKTGENEAAHIATKEGFIWKDIDWYDREDAIEPFDSGTSVSDVNDYLF